MKLSRIKSGGRAALCALAVAFIGAAPTMAATPPSMPPAELGGLSLTNAPRIRVAQATDAAQLAVRIQQLEEQIRSLNGQIEGLTFQLTQMQTIVERANEDNEFRFQALEGGGGGKTEAANQPGGVTRPEALPQIQTPAAGQTPVQIQTPTAAPAVPGDESAVPLTQIPEQGVKPLPGETEFDPSFDDGSAPMDELGNSSDPLVGTGQRGGVDLTTGKPLNLSYTPGASTDDPNADAQFEAGYEALARGDYGFAEDQFSQFMELYPSNPQVTDAANYLGDALLQRSAYSEAADVLLNAFQKAPDSPRAPELLLKLGMSLSGAGERETACRTFGEIDKRYTSLPVALSGKLALEKTKAECPPA